MKKPFSCNKCGLCCKSVTPELAKEFGLPLKPTGGCGHLQEDNSCGIYETRPWVCRVDETHLKLEMPWDTWVALNEEVCRKLQAIEEEKNATLHREEDPVPKLHHEA